MAIEKQTVIAQAETQTDGTVFLKLNKRVADGDTVLASEPHRTVFYPPVDVDAQLAAVNASLVNDLSYPALNETQCAWVKAMVTAARGAKA